MSDHLSPAGTAAPLGIARHPSMRRPAWRWLPFMFAACLGALNTLSFAPTPHGGWLELLILAAAVGLLARSRSLSGALLAGGAFGFGNFVCGIWCLYIIMHVYAP